jgi:hypothetical protein
MVISELKQTCPRCQGRKFLAGIADMGITQINPGGTCPACKGRGFLLTQKGQDLLDLLRPFILELVEPSAGRPTKPAAPREGQSDVKRDPS